MQTSARRARCFILALALPTLALATSSHRSEAAPKAQPKISLVANNAADWWTIVRKGAEKGAQAAGAKLYFRLPEEGTASQQTQIIDDQLAIGVDAIAVSAVDASGQIGALNRAAHSTLLFTFDSDAPQSQRACYVGTDEFEAGRQAGEEVKRVLPQGGEVMVFVGKIDAANARDRYAGLQQALRGSKVSILDVMTDDVYRTKARNNVSDALVRHPRLAACVGLWSYNGPAILSAVRDAHKTGKVKIVAFDEEDDTLEGVASGEISAAIVQQPFRIGEETVRAMAQVLAGDKSAIPVSKKIIVPSLAIRQANVAAFRQRLAAWRRK